LAALPVRRVLAVGAACLVAAHVAFFLRRRPAAARARPPPAPRCRPLAGVDHLAHGVVSRRRRLVMVAPPKAGATLFLQLALRLLGEADAARAYGETVCAAAARDARPLLARLRDFVFGRKVAPPPPRASAMTRAARVTGK